MRTAITTDLRTKRAKIVGRVLSVGVAAGLAAVVVTVGGSSGAKASSDTAGAAAPAADEAPGYAIEDFNYPQADKILAEQGITLKRGDGHIVLADCSSEGELIRVKSFPDVLSAVCFKVTGNSGWLTLEMPQVFSVMGNDYDTQVEMTTDGETRTWDIDKNLWTAVGQSADDQQREFALVEIRTSK